VVVSDAKIRVVSGAPQRRPLSHLPLWGEAAAAFLALWAAYARRKRLQRAWEAARARAARAAWDAADRARRLALVHAVARYRAKHPPKAPSPPHDTSLPRDPHLLLDGEVPVDEATSGRVPQPGPSRPDGSYTPHGLRDGYTPTHPVDLAAWKRQDYNQLARHQAAEAADRAFDAEVGTQNASRHCFNWNVALDPIEFVDTVKVLFVPVGTGLMTVVFLSIAAGLCDTGVGCLLAGEAVISAAASGTAAYLSAVGAAKYLQYRWHEITSCGDSHE